MTKLTAREFIPLSGHLRHVIQSARRSSCENACSVYGYRVVEVIGLSIQIFDQHSHHKRRRPQQVS